MKLRRLLRMFSSTAASIATLLAIAVSSTAQYTVQEKLTVAEKPFVRIDVIVTDAKGRTVKDLKREDLHVYEDGVEQPIAYFSKEVQPVSYGLIVDNSGSLRSQIASVVDSAMRIIDSNAPEDETFIVRFVSSDNIKVWQDFTSNKVALFKAIESMYVQGGQTAVIDAVYLGAEQLLKKSKPSSDKQRRHVLVLITDGDDRNSYYKIDDLLKLLKQSDIQIFCIGFTAELDSQRGFTRPGKREAAVKLLKRLANETGGRVFLPEKAGEMEAVISEIIANLHTQYVVGYDPPANSGGKTKHKIEVKVAETPGREKLKALVRPERTDASAAEAQGQKQNQ